MHFKRSIISLALFWAAVLCVGSSTVGVAAPPATGTPVFGSVDFQKVLNAYNKKADQETVFQAKEQQLQGVFQTEEANAMLSADDQKQLSTLLQKANQTDPDKAQITALEAKSQKDAQALATLQQTQTPTDADKTQLSQLTQEKQAGAEALQDVADSFKQQLDDENAKLTQQLADDVRAAVGSIAQQKGLTVVFDSQLAVYTPNDITQAVITKLNAAAAK